MISLALRVLPMTRLRSLFDGFIIEHTGTGS